MSIRLLEKQQRISRARLLWGLVLYNLALVLLSPVLVVWLCARVMQHKGIGNWRHRVGLVPRASLQAPLRVWLHAVSAGEMNALAPVYAALREAMPEAYLAVSAVTNTGMTVARARCPHANALFYLPFDLCDCMARALTLMRPDLIIVAEKELWPNFLGLARLFGIGVLVVNGRVSHRMLARARAFPWLVRWLYQLPTCLCVQSELDAARLAQLGVPAEKIVVAGNTKVDTMTARDVAAETKLAQELGVTPDACWLVAGSTHPGEEEAVLTAYLTIRQQLPQARLLLAPRHPERVADVCATVKAHRFAAALRSKGRPPEEAVVILDTMGELRAAYALGLAGFVGGTLAPIGGHNLLEPVAAGRPVCFGPHTESCADVAELVLEAQVGTRIADAETLAAWFVQLASNTAARRNVAQAGPALLATQQGAAQRCANIALALLQERVHGA